MSRRFAFAIAAVVAISSGQSQAFGPKGHKTVGAIADQRIAGKAVAMKIKELLHGLTLEQAAVLADDIKGWDKTPPGTPHAFSLPGHPEIEKDLIAFWKAHKDKTAKDYHRNFHFVDVPVGSNSKYADGDVGRNT